MDIDRRQLLFMGGASATIGLMAGSAALAQAAAADPVDVLAGRFMQLFEIPGIGIALIRPGQPQVARGYGVRALGARDPVDADTQFAIASNTKAFVAACLAILVEEGRLGWDEPVVRYMADFAMHDPDVTRMMTVRDLLVHRSGLPLGAGDLMQFPRTNHTREDMLRALRHLRPARGFRAGYDYDNILYIVAGILVERVSGLSWEDFLTDRLLRPLGMRHAVAGPDRLRSANVAGRHVRLTAAGGVQRLTADESPVSNPAGGIYASAAEILFWLQVQLGRGALPDGRRLWSEAQADEMWQPQVIVGSSPGAGPAAPTRPVLSAYALGWFVQDYRGRRLISHSGGLPGQITHTAFFPDHGIGLAVFGNSANNTALTGLRNALLDHALGENGFDWVESTRWRTEAQRAQAGQSGADMGQAPAGGPSLPLARYAGRYRDPWYGDIVVSERGGRLHIDFTHTPVYKSVLEPWGPDTFRTRFTPGVGEDAVVVFQVEGGGVGRLRLRAFSPNADFSYDFHHLEPVRVR